MNTIPDRLGNLSGRPLLGPSPCYGLSFIQLVALERVYLQISLGDDEDLADEFPEQVFQSLVEEKLIQPDESAGVWGFTPRGMCLTMYIVSAPGSHLNPNWF